MYQHFRNALLAFAITTTLGACAFLKDNGVDTARGASALADYRNIETQIEEYVAPSPETAAALQGPAEFVNRGYSVIEGQSDVPVLVLWEKYPAYFTGLKEQIAIAYNIMTTYEKDSKRPISQEIQLWWGDVKAGMSVVLKAKKARDYSVMAQDIVRQIAPLAKLAVLLVDNAKVDGNALVHWDGLSREEKIKTMAVIEEMAAQYHKQL